MSRMNKRKVIYSTWVVKAKRKTASPSYASPRSREIELQKTSIKSQVSELSIQLSHVVLVFMHT